MLEKCHKFVISSCIGRHSPKVRALKTTALCKTMFCGGEVFLCPLLLPGGLIFYLLPVYKNPVVYFFYPPCGPLYHQLEPGAVQMISGRGKKNSSKRGFFQLPPISDSLTNI
jgi:hypothetical protein